MKKREISIPKKAKVYEIKKMKVLSTGDDKP